MKNIVFILILTLSTCKLWALHPQRGYDFTPADFGMKYEEVKIETEDDLNLTGWMLEPLTQSKKCVVFCHGGEGNMQEYLEYAAQYVSLGYYVLLFDYRGYGTSSEFNISDRFYIYSQFSIDITAALDWVRKYHAVYKVSMAGVGMGAGLAVAIGANRSEVKYVVGDGTYPTLDIVQSQYQEVEGKKVLMPLGYDKVYMEPKFALESDKTDHLEGVLLIQSKNDKIITPQHAEGIADLQKKKSKVFLIDSEDNAKNLEANKDGYFATLKDFMGK